MIQPGRTIGILGGGQLGRMMIIAGRPMGYHFAVFDPSPQATASKIADWHMPNRFTDERSLEQFARKVDVITLEFENIPLSTLGFLEKRVALFPGKEILRVCQNRMEEKSFLRERNFPTADYKCVSSCDDLELVLTQCTKKSVLKTVELGYDGKGQVVIEAPQEADCKAVWEKFGGQKGILEDWIDFQTECSVICARNPLGEVKTFPVAENVHKNGILHTTIVPARIEPKVQEQAQEIAKSIADSLGIVGVIVVEFFVTKENELLVNELAPRPHNSGHYTLDATLTSQFEQHIRGVCCLPLADTTLNTPAVMVNLLGNLWVEGRDPNWSHVLNHAGSKIHLYDKGSARPGRKMGHFTLTGNDTAVLLEEAHAILGKLEAATQVANST